MSSITTLATLLRPKRTISAIVASAVASAVVAVPLLTAPSAGASVVQTPGLTSGTLSGVINHLGPNYDSTWSSWRNNPNSTVTAYGGTDSWASITAMGSIGWWRRFPYTTRGPCR